jgi:hypothetical protein
MTEMSKLITKCSKMSSKIQKQITKSFPEVKTATKHLQKCINKIRPKTKKPLQSIEQPTAAIKTSQRIKSLPKIPKLSTINGLTKLPMELKQICTIKPDDRKPIDMSLNDFFFWSIVIVVMLMMRS